MARRLGISAALLITLCGAAWLLLQRGAEPRQPVLFFDAEGTEGPAVHLAGLSSSELAAARQWDSEEWRRAFPVLTEREARRASDPEESAASPVLGTAMLGTYTVQGREVLFRPRFSFEGGLSYVARWQPGPEGSALELTFRIRREALEPSTRVAAVFPSSAVLPANLLRFYLQFSAPMSRGAAEDHLRLLDSDGRPVARPFVQMPQELWNPAGDRLTILLDPGRIKREVGPHRQVGAPLHEGRGYRLKIDPDWPDARGVPLVEGFEKAFQVGPADRSSPQPAAWRVEASPGASTEEIRVTLDEPVDHALGQRLIWIEDGGGTRVDGAAALENRETVWIFRPQAPLPPGIYSIVVAPELEDPSGNSLRRPFETPIPAEGAGPYIPAQPYRLPLDLPIPTR